jgi:tRNA(Ile)-lysidine synthase
VVLSRVLRTIRERHLVAKGDHLLVAVSGGPDSTALLHGLAKVAARLGITLVAACVDHRLRPESAEEAREVQRRCCSLGIACEILEVDVGSARKAHVSTQEAARNARLEGLESAAARLGCTKIALGHTADDQAETVLFRIVRGTGTAGLAGIPYQRGAFVRPLLDVRRAEILAFLVKRKVDFVTDPSNANRRYARSRIRHDMLPMLARENPRVVEALLALAHEARNAVQNAALNQARNGDGLDWRKALPAGLYLPRSTVHAVDSWLREGHGTRTLTVRNGELAVGYGKVSWLPRKQGEGFQAGTTAAAEQVVSGPGRYRAFAPPAPGLDIAPACTGAWPGGNAACFDAAKLAWPLLVRAPRPGDRMAPRAGRGTRKLSDLLIDAKIPRQERARLPVLCDAAGAILFVPGLRPAQTGGPDATTREWIEIHVLR